MSCLCLQDKAAEVSQSQVEAGIASSPFLGYFAGSGGRSITGKRAGGAGGQGSGMRGRAGRAPLGAIPQPRMDAALHRFSKDHCCLAPNLGRDAGDPTRISVAMNKTSAVCHFERP